MVSVQLLFFFELKKNFKITPIFSVEHNFRVWPDRKEVRSGCWRRERHMPGIYCVKKNKTIQHVSDFSEPD